MPGKPTSTIPDGGLFAVLAESKINASAEAVHAAIVDTAYWPKWNTFVPKVDINNASESHKNPSQMEVGTSMTFHVQMTPTFSTQSVEIVNILEGPPQASDASGTIYRICWVNDSSLLVPKFMLRSERLNEIEVCADGTCLYRSSETFTGPYARLVKWKFEQALQQRFDDWVRDLKAYVEGADKGNTATA